MVSSKASHLDRDLDHDADDHHPKPMDGHGGDAAVPTSSEVSCSICLDLVSDTGGRSRAKLQCGHEFHLDCIGSAFNTKGAMQCPNCRKVEKGQWLYANGSTRSLPELSMEDWNVDDDYYDQGYSELPFRVQWCPFGEFTRIGLSSEEVESPSTTYHEIHGHNAILHAAASSVAHSYVAYVGPLPPTTLRSSDSVDDPNFSRNWNSLSGHNEIFIPHALPTISIQYHSWGRHSPNFSVSNSHISNTDPASVPAAALRLSNGELDALSRAGSFPHPFPFEHGSRSRGRSSFVSSVFPRHPGGGARTHDGIQPSLAFYRRQHHLNQQRFNQPGVPAPVVPGIRRGLGPVAPAVPQPDQVGGFYIYPPSSSSRQNQHEAESLLPNNYSALQREHLSYFPTVSSDSGWGSYHPTHSSDSGNRSRSFLHRHYA